MANKFTGSLRKNRTTPKATETSLEQAIVETAADDNTTIQVVAEKKTKTQPKAKHKDMLIRLPANVHAELNKKAQRLTDEGIGSVSMRQLAAKLIEDGLKNLK